MSTLAVPGPSLANMPEEVLNQIISSLLPLKWYSLSVLVNLSRTNSYLRRWLMEDDSLWHLALLGRGMGRPLHTIPGYFSSHQDLVLTISGTMQAELNAKVTKEQMQKGALAVMNGNDHSGDHQAHPGGSSGDDSGIIPEIHTNGSAAAALTNNHGAGPNGFPKVMSGTAIISPSGEVTISATQAFETTNGGAAVTSPVSVTLSGPSPATTPSSSSSSSKKKKKGGNDAVAVQSVDQAQQAIIRASGLPASAFSFGDTFVSTGESGSDDAPRGTVKTSFTVKFDRLSGFLGGGAGAGGDKGKEKALGEGSSSSTDKKKTVDAEALREILKGAKKPSNPTPIAAPPLQLSSSNEATDQQGQPIKPPPMTYRDLALQVYTHEAGCVNCKVADSKLSHYYMTDGEMTRTAEKFGVLKGVLEKMQAIPGCKSWGEGKVVKGHFERVLTPEEASGISVRTSKFFAGYDFFGFCAHTLAIRVKTKSEPLTSPPLARIEFSVFVPAKAVITIVNGGVSLPNPEIVKISSFVVENWGGITLGDFQFAFETWINEPMTEQEKKDFEAKCTTSQTKGKKNTRVAFIPASYTSRFRMDDKLYEVGDIRPQGHRIENGKGAILLGDRYPTS